MPCSVGPCCHGAWHAYDNQGSIALDSYRRDASCASVCLSRHLHSVSSIVHTLPPLDKRRARLQYHLDAQRAAATTFVNTPPNT